jgi:radical SAM superfamily enzyme YgiQ (UPF0313 family)
MPDLSFEQGPIRPPSEATSLLLRVTRNCPWNRCEFCPVYKGKKFSRRPVEDVLADIEAMARGLDAIRAESVARGYGGEFPPEFLAELYHSSGTSSPIRWLLIWLSGGGTSAFLQDADSMVVKPENLATILRALRDTFPFLERVTCYARSQTLARRSVDDLAMLRDSGLDRVHVGLESGSDKVLKMVAKGGTAEKHITGGRHVVDAGLELSEYVMPGLGGRTLSHEHAVETAHVLNEIDPHFIRLRSLAVPHDVPLADRVQRGEFEIPWETEIVQEIRTFIARLDGIRSYLASDHILNLLMEVEGQFPQDKEKILAHLDRFLDLPPDDQNTYIIGRRSGLFRSLEEMGDPQRRRWAEDRAKRLQAEGRLEETVQNLMRRFI